MQRRLWTCLGRLVAHRDRREEGDRRSRAQRVPVRAILAATRQPRTQRDREGHEREERRWGNARIDRHRDRLQERDRMLMRRIDWRRRMLVVMMVVSMLRVRAVVMVMMALRLLMRR